MLKNFQIRDQDKFIKYNEDYVISPNNSSSEDQSSKDIDKDKDKDKEIGIGDEAQKIGLDLQYAFSVSVLKDIDVSEQNRKDMMEYSNV